MTCIVGIAERGRVWLGGDSASSNEDLIDQVKEPKVFRNGPALVGYTTSFRMGQILRHHLKVPTVADSEEVGQYMVTKFIPEVAHVFSQHGFDPAEEDGELFLVGILGRLFRVENDLSVGESVHGFQAIGSGGPVALGSLHTTIGHSQHPEYRCKLALSAAEVFNPAVRRPFTVLSSA